MPVVNQLLTGGEIPTTQSRIRAKSGELRDTLSSLELITLDEQLCILAIVQDNTERLRAENAEREQKVMAEALRDTAALLNSTLQLDEVLERMLGNLARVVPHDAASIMLVEDDETRIIRHHGFESFGTAIETLSQLRFKIAETQKFIEMSETGIPLVIHDVQAEPLWVSVAGTEWIRAHISAPIVFEGEILGIINVDSAQVGAFTNHHALGLASFAHQASIAIRNARHAAELERRVTERTAELSLERSRLEAILDFTGEGLFYTEEQIIRYANPTFCQMMGYSNSEIEGETTAFLIGKLPDDEFFQRWEQAKAALIDGHILRWEREFKRKDGTTFYAAQTISLVGEATYPIRVVSLVRDINEEKQLEAQKMRFIANAAHELRNPIMGLSTRLYLLNRQPERLDEHLPLLERATNRLTRLVEDLLDVARFENGVIQLHPREIALQDMVNDVIELQTGAALQKSIELTLDLVPDPLLVFVDPDRILQVLTNLVSNAIHYTFEGGLIDVKVFILEKEGLTYGVVSIEDNGAGIDGEDIAHIFKPFYRANKAIHGTGLGLSIAQEIIVLHNGEITVDSEVGNGSSFKIWLPLRHDD
ncbi:MAG: PAS domain S-box protein [Chitinophagaceae bacterium]|nr:PAS domain S-box protein [Anaerolineae bacterium]